ncbi:MAG: hypothetical protein LKJ76_00675 [Lachnospiraceae bacterium]|jgi:RNA polymerase primary sigma factor|nr:hypothetical protein [Lachnospiraceae bacterium]
MDETKKEQLFLQKLTEVIREAKQQGNMVTREELDEAFSGLSLEEGQMQQVRDYLQAEKIGIGQPVPAEELLTQEEHDYLAEYTETVNAIGQPDPSELEALELSAMAGEKDAQDRLAEVMLPKVVDIAKLYAGQGVFVEDLIGTGNEALVRGVKMLAPLENAGEAEGMLAKMIMNAMEDLVAGNLDESAKGEEAVRKVERVAQKAHELAETLGRKVTVDELAREGEVTKDEILDAVRFSGTAIEDLEK